MGLLVPLNGSAGTWMAVFSLIVTIGFPFVGLLGVAVAAGIRWFDRRTGLEPTPLTLVAFPVGAFTAQTLVSLALTGGFVSGLVLKDVLAESIIIGLGVVIGASIFQQRWRLAGAATFGMGAGFLMLLVPTGHISREVVVLSAVVWGWMAIWVGYLGGAIGTLTTRLAARRGSPS